MKLKVINSVEKEVFIIELSNIEYSEGASIFMIWDVIGDMALVKCHHHVLAEKCVKELWENDRAELVDGDVDWDPKEYEI